MTMKNYRVYANQKVCYAINIQAESEEQAHKLAEEANYSNWEEVDYTDWEIMEDWTEEEK